jgi:hypothetical protein
VTNSDRLVEAIYDLVAAQKDERSRSEVARIALLAGQYRAEALRKRPKKPAPIGGVKNKLGLKRRTR